MTDIPLFKLTVHPLGSSSPLIIRKFTSLPELETYLMEAAKRGSWQAVSENGSIYCVPFAATAHYLVEPVG